MRDAEAVYVRLPTWRRLIATVAGIAERPVYGPVEPTQVALVDAAVVKECRRLEKLYNDGRPFPPVTAARRGRPRRIA